MITNSQYIKIDITHSILKLRLPEIKFNIYEPVFKIKENLERRFGTSSSFMTLLLKDNNANFICELDDENKLFQFYSPQEGYMIHCIDNDPNSITKVISNDSLVEKYVMSDEDYDKLPMNIRKFKENLKKNNPEFFNKSEFKHNLYVDENFEKDIAENYKIGDRCELKLEKHRGEVCFIGKILDKGEGYFVGIRLDEPFGKNEGKFKGIKYFESMPGYGLFLRPSEIEVGDFPEIDIDEF